MKRAIMFGMVALAMAGCALEPASTYQVYVDPNFSDYEVGVIRDSLVDWENQTDHTVNFHVDVMKSWGTATPPHTIWIQSASQSDVRIHGRPMAGMCYQGSHDDNGFVYLPMDKYEGHEAMAWFGQAVRHEVGHALGLSHSSKGTIMAPSHGEASMTVTCEDAKALVALHDKPAGWLTCETR
jgi:hypothetical protein